MRALISVSDKSGVENFAKELVSLGYEIISTGGTYNKLKDAGIAVIEANEVTRFPECFEGRVKTLNPYIHGGILHRRDKQSHLDQAKELGVEGIDLVCVNLYPFKATIEKTDVKFTSVAEAKAYITKNKTCGEMKGKELQAVGLYLGRR